MTTNPFAYAVADSAVEEFLSVVEEYEREFDECPSQCIAARHAMVRASHTDAIAGGPFSLLVFRIAEETGLIR